MKLVNKNTSVVIYHLEEEDFLTSHNVELIADHTQNTWQLGRDKSEKISNTAQGKLAENVVSDFLNSYTAFTYLSYDEFRNDAFKKHAPFDGVIYSDESRDNLEIVKQRVCAEVNSNEFGKISTELRSYICQMGFRIIEVKSTKVNDKKRPNSISFEASKSEYLKSLINTEILRQYFINHPQSIDKYTFLQNSAFTHWVKEKCSKMC